MFNGSVEDLINKLESSITESLKELLKLSLSGKPPPLLTTNLNGERESDIRPTQIKLDPRALPPITESFDSVQTPSLFTWTFQHVCQVIELTLKILLTKQIEECLVQAKIDDLKVTKKFFFSEL